MSIDPTSLNSKLSNNSGSLANILLLLQQELAAANKTSGSSATAATSATSASDSSSLSGPAALLHQLETLSKTNPSEFKTITAQVAQQLHAVASNSINATKDSGLDTLVSNFEKASSSGSFADLLAQNSLGPTSATSAPASPYHLGYGDSQANTLFGVVSSIFTKAVPTAHDGVTTS